jgi:hypothetical protein
MTTYYLQSNPNHRDAPRLPKGDGWRTRGGIISWENSFSPEQYLKIAIRLENNVRGLILIGRSMIDFDAIVVPVKILLVAVEFNKARKEKKRKEGRHPPDQLRGYRRWPRDLQHLDLPGRDRYSW